MEHVSIKRVLVKLLPKRSVGEKLKLNSQMSTTPKYIITIDTNPAETPIFNLLEDLVKFDGGLLVRKRLDIGDIQITNASGAELLFERKTFGDLCSSLDGRYGEQKSRIFAEQERRATEGIAPMKVAFLIESRAVPSWSGAHATVKNANAYAALTKSAL